MSQNNNNEDNDIYFVYVNNLGYPYLLILPNVSHCFIRFDKYHTRNSDSENY